MDDDLVLNEAPPDEWEFYPCDVEDEPASILVNLRFMIEDPRGENDHVHHAFLRMIDAGPSGVGTQQEMERLSPIEDAVFDRVEKDGGEPVGRVRAQGIWRLSAYGPKNMPWIEWVRAIAGPEVDVQTEADPEFTYINDFLLPDAERYQWISDRRICDQLAQHGDEAGVPRPVNHFIDYEGEAPSALLHALKGLGFDVTDLNDSLECTKVHDVRLDTVHEIVMALVELAEQHDAAYEGWGAPVTPSSGAAPN